jgi:hypothetical protein
MCYGPAQYTIALYQSMLYYSRRAITPSAQVVAAVAASQFYN